MSQRPARAWYNPQMIWWQAVIFGIVEGLTEFLPISSTGHLILTAKLLGLSQTEFLKSFEICIQLGAIFAVVLVYGRTLLKKPEFSKKIFVALLPTLVLGFFLYKVVRNLLSDPSVILWSLFLGGLVLVLFDLWHREREDSIRGIDNVPYSKSFWIGAAQSLAMVPGVSRAGATIVGGLALGLNRKTIVEFSFLLAVPTLLAATALDLIKNGAAFHGNEWGLLLLGAAVSCAVAVGVIRFFIRYVQNRGFLLFGVYRMLAAVVFWTFLK